MVDIKFISLDGTESLASGAIGDSVMMTALKNDVDGITGECGGQLACATCHVYVDDSRGVCGTPSDIEESMLELAHDVRPNSRLCCQIKVSEELKDTVFHIPERQN